MKDLVLFGAGGSGREMAYLVDTINSSLPEPKYNLLGFIDDNEEAWGKVLNGYKVIGGSEWLIEHKDSVYCNVTLGTMVARTAVCKKLKNAGVKFETLIHPTASIGPDVQIGEGCLINEHCELTCNIKVGDFVFINSGTALGHDDVIGDYTIFNPRATVSGAVTIGEGVMVGGMSFIVQLAKIGDNAVIAPGSVVYGRVKAGTQVMGNPAKRINI